jgi:hypothetical protein
MEQAIEKRRGNNGIAEHVAPFDEGRPVESAEAGDGGEASRCLDPRGLSPRTRP